MTWASSSALAPAGPQAARLADVYWGFFAICAVVYVAMMTLLVFALRRRERLPFDERGRLRWVARGGAISVAVLLALLAVSVRAGHGLNPRIGAQDVLTVRVVARQWWWEFQYPGDAPDQLVTTANEMHIPAGRPILLELSSRDVIHSFWVPTLHGKRDLIPGHDSTTYIEANEAGVFRGQCAEFCGVQHAKMGFLVVAQSPADFQSWLEAQRRPANPPDTPAAIRGQALFVHGPCAMCHAIGGTTAAATMGPDLTHIHSRTTLGAGSVPNARQHLTAWITDSQNVKPGNHMPPLPMREQDLDDLVAYLETLR
jgi:cytochrome c oxidase subunit 2